MRKAKSDETHLGPPLGNIDPVDQLVPLCRREIPKIGHDLVEPFLRRGLVRLMIALDELAMQSLTIKRDVDVDNTGVEGLDVGRWGGFGPPCGDCTKEFSGL